MTNILRSISFFIVFVTFTTATQAAEKELFRQIGVARIDITPDYPIRLSGYGNRRKESEGIARHIFAKALAIGGDKERPALLITVDNCGVPASLRDEVVRRLRRKKNI